MLNKNNLLELDKQFPDVQNFDILLPDRRKRESLLMFTVENPYRDDKICKRLKQKSICNMNSLSTSKPRIIVD